tara:strand:- start:193 stop:309 length:117 start_codon:yes stop_codon:yes gene_type:complete
MAELYPISSEKEMGFLEKKTLVQLIGARAFHWRVLTEF